MSDINPNALMAAWTEFCKAQSEGVTDIRSMERAMEVASKYMVSGVEITDAMRHAGADAITKLTGAWNAEPSGVMNGEMAVAAFQAMVRARYPSENTQLRNAEMGDHRASIKIEFQMHGVTTTREMWINWWDGACYELPNSVVDAFREAEDASMAAWRYQQEVAESESKAKRAVAIQSARQKLTDEEWEAIKGGK